MAERRRVQGNDIYVGMDIPRDLSKTDRFLVRVVLARYQRPFKRNPSSLPVVVLLGGSDDVINGIPIVDGYQLGALRRNG